MTGKQGVEAVIEQDARVVSVEIGFAWVETARRSSCSGCSVSSGCGTSVVAELLGERASRLKVSDGIGVEVGDRVVIGIADAAFTRASLLAYLLPLLMLMLAALAAQTLGVEDESVALIGILGLALGLAVAGHLTGGASARERYRPALLRRLPPQGIRALSANPAQLTNSAGREADEEGRGPEFFWKRGNEP